MKTFETFLEQKNQKVDTKSVPSKQKVEALKIIKVFGAKNIEVIQWLDTEKYEFKAQLGITMPFWTPKDMKIMASAKVESINIDLQNKTVRVSV